MTASDDMDHPQITQAIKPSSNILGGPPCGRLMSHYRGRDVSLPGQGCSCFGIKLFVADKPALLVEETCHGNPDIQDCPHRRRRRRLECLAGAAVREAR